MKTRRAQMEMVDCALERRRFELLLLIEEDEEEEEKSLFLLVLFFLTLMAVELLLLLLLLSSGKKTSRRPIPQLSLEFLDFAEKPINGFSDFFVSFLFFGHHYEPSLCMTRASLSLFLCPFVLVSLSLLFLSLTTILIHRLIN